MAFTKEDGISVGLLAIIGGVVLPGFVTAYLVLSNYLHETKEEARIEKTYTANRAQYESVKGTAEAKLNTQSKTNPGLDKTGQASDQGREKAKINIANAMELVVVNQAKKSLEAAQAKSAAASEEATTEAEANDAAKSDDQAKPADNSKPAESQDSSVKKKQG